MFTDALTEHAAFIARQKIMFCAFDNPALILRIYGKGLPVHPEDEGFAAVAALFPQLPGVRQVFDVAVESVQTSCGWGVPRMSLEAEPPTLVAFHGRQDKVARLAKIAGRTRSIDGLPVRVQTVIPEWD